MAHQPHGLAERLASWRSDVKMEGSSFPGVCVTRPDPAVTSQHGLESVVLGRTGLHVTRMVFGGGPIGGLFAPVSEGAARATLEAAWSAGIRAFDTAPHYGVGLSE